MNPAFRALYGDELADQVEKIVNKPRGVEVLRWKPARRQPPPEPTDAQKVVSEPPSGDEWWNR